MIPVDLMIFDLDGTLVDSVQDIACAANFARASVGLAPVPVEMVERAIGDGVKTLISRIVGPDSPEQQEKALKIFRTYYGEHLLDRTKDRPGTREVLEYFRSKKKAVLTNKGRDASVKILEGLGLSRFFEMVEGGDGPNGRKPHPAGITKIINYFGIPLEKSVIIGDSPVDVETGRSVGVHTCAILDGYSQQESIRKARPDVVLNTLQEIKDYFN